jgi:hypothetical protein
MKRILTIIIALSVALGAAAQKRKVQNKPYIDLRPMHFGILIGMNLQDVEFQNVGPQTIRMEDGTEMPASIVCDADMWNPGFSVGVLADIRLNQHFALRFSPAMHFGSKRLTFRNLLEMDESGMPSHITQDLKNTYISMPIDLKFAAQRFNNYRPYIMAGLNPMINLAGKDQEYIQLKRYDVMFEVGMGCDFYLRFFKLIPELKFCFGMLNALDSNHIAELSDINKRAHALSVTEANTKMIVFTLHFE